MSDVGEVIKWGHLVYFSNGPVFLVRAEDERVLFGFWRGQSLRDIEPRLRGGGKYEMATLELVEGTPLERQFPTAAYRTGRADPQQKETRRFETDQIR